MQTDIERVLAYSTISQIGYMFLALGVGAWSAAIFHFITHAFFKALLFLSAGAIIVALHHEQDMFKMGGLRKKLPGVFIVFLIGAASLAALPFVTAGFYSKDQIVWLAWTSAQGNTAYWLVALTGAFITAMYTFRMVFLVFYGTEKTHVHHRPGNNMMVPLYILAVLSTLAGFIELPHTLGHLTPAQRFSGACIARCAATLSWQHCTGVDFPGHCCLIIHFRHLPDMALLNVPFMDGLKQFWKNGWGFDVAYDWVFVKPFVSLARINRSDIVDKLYTGSGYDHLFFTTA